MIVFNAVLDLYSTSSQDHLSMVRLRTPNNGNDFAEVLVGGNRGLILRTFTDDVATLNNQNTRLQPAGTAVLLCQHQNVYDAGTFHNNSDSVLKDEQKDQRRLR